MWLHIILLAIEVNSITKAIADHILIDFRCILLYLLRVEIVQSNSSIALIADVHVLLAVILDLPISLELDLIILYIWSNVLLYHLLLWTCVDLYLLLDCMHYVLCL